MLETVLYAVCCRPFHRVSSCAALSLHPSAPGDFSRTGSLFFSFTVSISTLITLNQAIRISQIPSVRGFAEGVTSHPPKLCVCKLSWSYLEKWTCTPAFRNATEDYRNVFPLISRKQTLNFSLAQCLLFSGINTTKVKKIKIKSNIHRPSRRKWVPECSLCGIQGFYVLLVILKIMLPPHFHIQVTIFNMVLLII